VVCRIPWFQSNRARTCEVLNIGHTIIDKHNLRFRNIAELTNDILQESKQNIQEGLQLLLREMKQQVREFRHKRDDYMYTRY
jgi:hypothetical protein